MAAFKPGQPSVILTEGPGSPEHVPKEVLS